MKEVKFRYYNRALIPNCIDCEEISFTKEELKEAFKRNKKALFFAYTSNFDCGFDTGWYYVINDGGISNLHSSPNFRRKNNKVKRLVECKEITFTEYKEPIVSLGKKCVSQYKNYGKNIPSFDYSNIDGIIIGAFDKESKTLIGFSIIQINNRQINLSVEKTDLDFKRLMPSFALNLFILENYVDFESGQYASNGARTISHVTNHNDFLIETFGFRKAYCRLILKYRNTFVLLLIIFLRILSPFLKLFDKIHLIHLVNGVLLMDKISRKQKKMTQFNG